MDRSKTSPLSHVIALLTSLKLTIACLAFGMILILVGTLAQVELGINQVLDVYFRSFIAIWKVPGTIIHVPLPGGFLIGGVLMINLLAAHFYRFRLSWKKSGILLTHIGLIVLLLGELFTALFARESAMRLSEGETKNYSEARRENELAIIDRTDPAQERTLAIAESGLRPGTSYQRPEMPFRMEIRGYYANSQITRRAAQTPPPEMPVADQGIGPQFLVREIPRAAKDTEMDITSVWVELIGTNGSLGTWLVSNVFAEPQPFTYEGRPYTLELRPRRFYKDFEITLLDFTHDVYPGTEIARNYSSRIRLNDPRRNENREVLIYMNHPLRYDGLTFFQQGYEGAKTTILQVVRNPSRHLPYISCALVFLGLTVQFGIHLAGFLGKRRAATHPATP